MAAAPGPRAVHGRSCASFMLEAAPTLAPTAFGAFLAGGLTYGLGTWISQAARKREQERH